MEKVLNELKLKVPPLALFLLTALLMWLLARWLDAHTTFSALWSLVIMLTLGAGLAVIAVSALTLYLGKTTLDPRFPHKTGRLITGGIYAYSRNPTYLGLLLLLLGWNLYLDSLYATPGLLLFFGLVTRLQIVPEEQALEMQFGDSYLGYCQRVRRWL
ncbi:MAG: isoprenylcysteine carboxylmethyltransferase family protein [Gammaproteobacteria bacterium]|nr:MAG: isoprenylcysteine carboxylmethyltransferase family protein [Gammaproteobacteria bacterium]